ncbi:MAG: hypothetical protein HZB26_17265 [Candidatus Hydrogenedentes bacterium]|nr:hypothetical protein [Candidatus Hydrogenedentota bacterium]
MKRLKTNSKQFQQQTLPRKAILIWSNPNVMDGFSYSFVYQDGAKGILVTGGIAGISEFHPLFQKGA